MAKRSQVESEQPAKVYQLDAVEGKVDSANGKLDAILEQTSSLVTRKELDIFKDEIKKDIKDEVDKIHLKYGPTKRNLIWLTRGVIMAVIGLVIQLIITLITANRSS